MSLFQVIVHSVQCTHALQFDHAPIGLEIKQNILNREPEIPIDMLALRLDDMTLNDQDVVPFNNRSIGQDDNNVTTAIIVRASIKNALPGGKGGFGAMLRYMAKQKGKKQTTDYGACRDLSGRRLRHVNDEIILQKWKEAKNTQETFDTEQQTASGIDLWFLSTPNWADSIKVDKVKQFLKPKLKTSICIDWQRAREHGRRAPEGAPAHWGCPRGHRCQFAHGKEELKGETRKTIDEIELQKQKDALSDRKDAYIGVIAKSTKSDEDINDLVMAGLKAAAGNNTRSVAEKPDSSSTSAIGSDGRSVGAKATAAVTLPNKADKLVAASVERLASDSDKLQVLVLRGNIIADCSTGMVSGTACTETETSAAAATAATTSSSGSSSGSSSSNYNVLNNRRGSEGRNSASFASACLNHAGVPASMEGNWYYEIEARTDGLMQIGWMDDKCSSLLTPVGVGGEFTRSVDASDDNDNDDEDGVGDDVHSWSFDGLRGVVWHSGEEEKYGFNSSSSAASAVSNSRRSDSSSNSSIKVDTNNEWKKGAIVGCFLQIKKIGTDRFTASFSYALNGTSFGVAHTYTYDAVSVSSPASASASASPDAQSSPSVFVPAFSMEASQELAFNIGHWVFAMEPSITITEEKVGESDVASSTSTAAAAAKRARKGIEKGKKELVSTTVACLPVINAPDTLPIEMQSSTAAVASGEVVFGAAVDKARAAVTGTVSTVATTGTEAHTLIDLESAVYDHVDALKELGMSALKQELESRGLKCGGTIDERATRLFSVRGLTDLSKVDDRIKAKKKN